MISLCLVWELRTERKDLYKCVCACFFRLLQLVLYLKIHTFVCMVQWKARIARFDHKGEKTGWRYVMVPAAIANQLKEGERRSMRVRGMIDSVPVEGLSLLPMGEGDFILALNTSLRKKLRKEEGADVILSLEWHADFEIDLPEDLQACLEMEESLFDRFMRFSKSHRNYFITWLNTAKTEATRTKRLLMIVHAMENHLDYSQMIRHHQKKKEN